MMVAEPGRPNELSPIKDRYSPRATRSKRGRPQLHRARLAVAEPFVESFGSRVRDEVLSVEAFDSVLEAQTVITEWRTIYTTGGHTALSAGDRRRPMPLA
jgi:hypothetical protein